MPHSFCAFIALFCVLCAVAQVQGSRIKMTNIKCISYDEAVVKFRHCYLKLIKRGIPAVFVHLENHSPNVMNLTMNFEFLKKANGYRPFLYNISLDFCKVAELAKTNMIVHLLVQQVGQSRVHACPYNEDIVFDRYLVPEQFLERLPAPSGDYQLNIRLSVYNVPTLIAMTFFTVFDKL